MVFEKSIETLCYIVYEKKILLVRKKEEPGKGKLNGPGGHFEASKDGSIEEAADRETTEECGLRPQKMEKRGIVLIKNEATRCFIELHIFWATDFVGELAEESRETINQWYPIDDLDLLFSQMWPNDRFTLPPLLAGKKIIGYVHYDEKGEIVQYFIYEVDVLPQICDLNNNNKSF